jgi:cell division protease FtsH
MIGPERKSHILSEEEKKITAYHEGGHALVASLLEFSDPVHKISIISRGHAAGYTLKLPLEERRFHSRKVFLDDIAVSLGGYAAEMMPFDDLTTGPSNDLQVATGLAHNMVAKYGMSSSMGPIAFEGSGGILVGQRGMIEREYSQDVAMRIDQEVAKIMNDGLARAKDILTKYRHVLDAIAMELIRVETIEHEDFEKLLTLHGIKPKRKVGEKPYVAPTAAKKTDAENEEVTAEASDTSMIVKQPHTAFPPLDTAATTNVLDEAVSPKHGRKKEHKKHEGHKDMQQ